MNNGISVLFLSLNYQGAWADTSDAQRILDIGTGTGLIALMMAQRNAKAQVEAIEIDPEAFQEAVQNVQESGWSNRIKLECCAFQDFVAHTDRKFNLIVSNPPFFVNSLKAPNESRSKARHTDSLPFSVLISGAAGLLNEHGRIALVLPIESLPEIQELAVLHRLFISRCCRVKPNPQKPEFRILIELTFDECVVQEESLMIEFEQHHDYTPEYQELTKDFYLKF